MFFVIFILGDLLHCACSNYTVDKCVGNDTSHSRCLVTENNTCAENCINPDLYEATGDNKKCIVKACSSYSESTCYLNDACVLTEETPTKCASACLDFKIFLPVDGECVKSGCKDRKPKSMSVTMKVNRVKFNYGYKSNNNVGITVMGIQKNTSFYSGTSNQTDFEYKEEGFQWDNVREENLENVRIQVYTDKRYFIGQAYINISEYKTPEGIKKNITIESGDVTIPIQNQTLSIEVGICTACASAGWPCGDTTEGELCYQDLDNCSPTCTVTDDAHYEADNKTGICERVCEERKKSDEDSWPCGNNYESKPCFVNTGAAVGEPECARECSNPGWYAVKEGGDRCEWKDCTARQANDSPHPCGGAQDCVFDPAAPMDGPQCVEECPTDEQHTGQVENGRCVLACHLRQANVTASHPCGSAQDCLFDPVAPTDGPQCVEKCPIDEQHTGDVDSGRCVVELNCAARKANLTADFPCGALQDCLFDPIAQGDEPQCVNSCTKDDKHTGEIEDGVCELACALLTADPNAAYPCGDADCMYDPAAPTDGSQPQCLEACPEDDTHTGAAENGVCVLACAARMADVTVSEHPCSSRSSSVVDCLYDPVAPIGGPVCVEVCLKDDKHTGDSENGVCVLACALRKPDHAATFPCGHRQDCLLDLAVPEDQPQCVEKCPIDEWHSGEVFSGRCVVGLNCAARKANNTVLSYQCGQDCLFDPAAPTDGSQTQCVELCPEDEKHTDTIEDGQCALVCALRKADHNATFPCGATLSCLFDPAAPTDGAQCVEKCPFDEQHTGEVDDKEMGRCAVGLNCAARKADVSNKCGQDCIFDPVAATDEPQCVATCPKDEKRMGTMEEGQCALVCAIRTADITAEFPCGAALSCKFDPAAPTDGKQCVDQCPNDTQHTGDAENGECVIITVPKQSGGQKSWWDGPKIWGMSRMWFVVVVAAIVVVLLIIIVITVLIFKKQKKKKQQEGEYESIND